MKEHILSPEDRKEVVLFRIEKAKATYHEAIAIINLNFVNSGANRLYYSAYYAVSALLIAYGITARTHSGVIQMFGRCFIKPKLLENRFGITYSRLFSLRMTGDYEDRRNLDMEMDIIPLVKPAEELIDVVTKMALEKVEAF